jgi:hypothetical protein
MLEMTHLYNGLFGVGFVLWSLQYIFMQMFRTVFGNIVSSMTIVHAKECRFGIIGQTQYVTV